MSNPEKIGKYLFLRGLEQKEKAPADFDVQAESIASEKHLDRNEDAIFVASDKKTFGVLDGMGGHSAGEVASSEAKKNILESLEKIPSQLSLEQVRLELEKIINETNEQLIQMAEAKVELRGMGTTVSIVKIWEKAGERKAVIANIGDSRVYILRTNGSLEQITLDDNAISYTAKDEGEARLLQEKLSNAVGLDSLTPQEKLLFKKRNEISQALGRPGIETHMSVVDVQAGEKLIITSDGIHDNLTDVEIAEIIKSSKNSREAVNNLTIAAQIRSREKHPRSKADDMSAIVAEFSPISENKKIEDEKKIDLTAAKDFTELFEAIEKMGGVQGSEKFYEATDLVQKINLVRRGVLPLFSITRNNGLRQKVDDLIKIEELHKKIA